MNRIFWGLEGYCLASESIREGDGRNGGLGLRRGKRIDRHKDVYKIFERNHQEPN